MAKEQYNADSITVLEGLEQYGKGRVCILEELGLRG